jgi:hypothetical protein
LENRETIARDVSDTLGLSDAVKNLYIEDVDSPWNEKALIKRRRGQLDVKLTVWNDPLFLYGRLYRLFLYIYDVLNPSFQYDPATAPDEDKEPFFRERYNQIWSIYVDSRLERIGIEDFFDKTMRGNLFIDVERGWSWAEAKPIFEKLWDKELYTYPEIIGYAYNLDTVRDQLITPKSDATETEISQFLKGSDVKLHVERVPSVRVREIINELLSFTAYHCKDVHIEASYYDILVMYQRRLFAEIIPTKENVLFLTLFNPLLHRHETHEVTEDSDVKVIQDIIKDRFNNIAAPHRAM